MIKKFIAAFILSFLITNISNAETITVDVNGLVCEFCAVTIEKNFNKKPEIVKLVKVNLNSKKVTIILQKEKNLSDEEVRDIIVNNGYNVVKINRSK